MPIPTGSKAPDFTLKSKQASGLVDVKLSNNFGKKNTVLLFFPLAFTSVCTKEMCDLTAGLGAYAGLNADVIGISVDSPFAQEAWAQEGKNRHHARQRFEQDHHQDIRRGVPDAGRRGRHGGARGVRD